MIDAADREKIEASRNELHNLLDKPQLQGIPVSMTLAVIPSLKPELMLPERLPCPGRCAISSPPWSFLKPCAAGATSALNDQLV